MNQTPIVLVTHPDLLSLPVLISRLKTFGVLQLGYKIFHGMCLMRGMGNRHDFHGLYLVTVSRGGGNISRRASLCIRNYELRLNTTALENQETDSPWRSGVLTREVAPPHLHNIIRFARVRMPKH